MSGAVKSITTPERVSLGKMKKRMVRGMRAGALAAGVEGAQGLQMGEEAPAQVAFHPHGDGLGADFVQAAEGGAKEHQAQQVAQPGRNLGQGSAAEEDGVHDAAEIPGLADGGEPGQPEGAYGEGKGEARATG